MQQIKMAMITFRASTHILITLYLAVGHMHAYKLAVELIQIVIIY